MKFTDIPVPARMAKLKKDRRGYPIPAMVVVDDDGRPHFQINDERIRQKMIAEDRCPICAGKLARGRWFVGGPLSAFSSRGLFIDPPTHDECAHYALRVCPYLAAPNYGREIGARTLEGKTVEGISAISVDPTVLAGRPATFVAVMAVGQDYIQATGPFAAYGFAPSDIRYTRHKFGTVRRLEIWRHGGLVREPEELEAFFRKTTNDMWVDYGESPRADMVRAFAEAA